MTSDKALVVLLVCLARYYETSGEVDAAFKKNYRQMFKAAAPAAKTYKLNAKPFNVINRAINAGVFSDEIAETFEEIGQILQAAQTRLGKLSVPIDQFNLVKDVGVYFRSESEAALKRIRAKVSALGEPWLAGYYVGAEPLAKDPQKADIARMTSLVKKLGGTGALLTPEQSKEFKAADPDTYAQYLAAKREAMLKFKNFLSDTVRSSGKKYLPVLEVLKALKAAGITVHNIPTGFDKRINIDDRGNYWVGDKAISQGIGGGTVEMNPGYGDNAPATYVFRGMAPFAVGWTRFYTKEAKLAGRDAKHKKVEQLASSIDKIRLKWQKDLKAGTEPKATLALILELMYLTSGRIGSLASATGAKSKDGSKSYGISVLQNKQVTLAGNKIRIKYPGKKGVMQTHVVPVNDQVTKRIAARLLELKDEYDPSEHLFWFNDKRVVSNTDLNTYFKGLGAKTTVHKLRHVKGDNLLLSILAKSPLKKGSTTQSQALNWLKDQITRVIGPALGHMNATGKVPWTTSAANYLSPGIQRQFFDSLDVKIPPYLEKLLRDDS